MNKIYLGTFGLIKAVASVLEIVWFYSYLHFLSLCILVLEHIFLG